MRTAALTKAILLPAILAPGLALATNGYFSHGFGVKSQGMAGAGIALPQDGLAAAINPAGTAFVGNRVDLGMVLVRPQRSAEISGNLAGMNGDYAGNDTRNFLVPEIGYVEQLSPRLAAGVAVYGNGGLNTDYGNNPFRALGATGAAGVNLEQLFISPSLAWKLADEHAVGLALNIAYQRFEVEGIAPFAAASSSPGNFTNRGVDSALGWGIRLGYTGKLSDDLTLGLTWASKTRSGELDKYKGLFAEHGGFDIPANYGLGLSWAATPALTLVADVKRIEYGDVKALANPIGNLFAGHAFGSANGPGMGWRDITAVKLGIQYRLAEWTLRAGYSHSSQPVPSDQTLLNILTPSVVKDHVSVGATWQSSRSGELSLAYTYALKNTVHGRNSIPGAFGGGEADLTLKGDIIGIAYGWKF
ncbi:MAG: long-chain fatty acid transporter [Betaproteobacteria bacterium HGW-Betaproteobacteria-12]|nr:MAG: long-chain fatty acid transporter [Betaproteobacteria bacterium HGW-Betaproteobacteria-12]